MCGQRGRSVRTEMDAAIKGREKARCGRVEGAGKAEEKVQVDGRRYKRRGWRRARRESRFRA